VLRPRLFARLCPWPESSVNPSIDEIDDARQQRSGQVRLWTAGARWRDPTGLPQLASAVASHRGPDLRAAAPHRNSMGSAIAAFLSRRGSTDCSRGVQRHRTCEPRRAVRVVIHKRHAQR